MSSTPNSVRLARTSDVDDVARVQVAAWRAAYADLLPSVVLDALDADEIAWEWGRSLLQPGPHRLLVAIGPDGSVVGAAAVGPSSDPDAAGAGEISGVTVTGRAFSRHASTISSEPAIARHSRGCRWAMRLGVRSCSRPAGDPTRPTVIGRSVTPSCARYDSSPSSPMMRTDL